MPAARLQSIDALRGLAITLMVAYHFCYDLTYVGLVKFDFYTNPFWLHSRTFILSLFLLLVGISLRLATYNGIHWPAYARRLALIAASAAAISLVSYLMFQQRWIFFGVLHFITLASLLGLAFVRTPRLALLLGIGLIWLDNQFQHPFFDQPGLQWIGLMTHKPATEDYVPLIPWLGVTLIGIFIGSRLPTPSRTAPAAPTIIALLSRAGRHSLLIYMLHQPLLIAGLMGVKKLVS